MSVLSLHISLQRRDNRTGFLLSNIDLYRNRPADFCHPPLFNFTLFIAHLRNLSYGIIRICKSAQIWEHDLTFRTETDRKSFFPSMTLFWNNLEENIKHLEKLPLKQTHLTKHKPICNPYYYLGNRQFNIIMARLRLRCSELRQHLFDINIIDNNVSFCSRMPTIHCS